MVEASEQLRKQQAQLLSGTDQLKETDIGWTAPCKHIPGCDIIWCEDIRFVPKGKLVLVAGHFDLQDMNSNTTLKTKHPPPLSSPTSFSTPSPSTSFKTCPTLRCPQPPQPSRQTAPLHPNMGHRYPRTTGTSSSYLLYRHQTQTHPLHPRKSRLQSSTSRYPNRRPRTRSTSHTSPIATRSSKTHLTP